MMSLEQAIWECEKWNNKEGNLNKEDGVEFYFDLNLIV